MYNMSRWNYYDAAQVPDSPLVHTTNGSEGQNSHLNNRFRHCKSLSDALKEIKEFKTDEIIRYGEIMNGHYQARRPDTVERHNTMKDYVNQFASFHVVQQSYVVVDTAMTIGKLMTCLKK